MRIVTSDGSLLNPPQTNPQNKVCYKCHTSYPLNLFNKCKTGIYGLHNECRACQKITRKEWYDKNKKSQQHIWLKNARDARKQPSARAAARLQLYHWRQKPQNKIACSLRSRLYSAMKGFNKISTTQNLLGCSFQELKNHLESLWQPNMSWDNYGTHGWHIDHIRPCASFNLLDPLEQKKCFHYSNLQPLWAKENWSKHDKFV